MKKSENPNAFFPNKGRCETPQAVPRSQPAIRFKCSYGHSRYRLRHFEHKSHGSKPCLGPFTYPLPLYVWSEPMYGFLRDIHRCFLYALVHGCRLPRTIQKPFRCIAGMHSLNTNCIIVWMREIAGLHDFQCDCKKK